MTSARQPAPRLLLVVGPSGAGKDTLIDAARAVFAGVTPVDFPRRFITRAQDAGGEAHIAIDAEGFTRLKAEGAFCLDWTAHGLNYGIPKSAVNGIAEGRSALANVSRAILSNAETLGVPVGVIHVTASPEILAARLAGRGRESAPDILERMKREVPLQTNAPLVTVVNDGTLADAKESFIAAIETLTGVERSAAR